MVRGAEGARCIFVYGSLQSTEVLRILLRRVPLRKKAHLKNYRRFAIPNRTYPGVGKDGSGGVSGVVLLGLTEDDVAILDEFEGDEYVRVEETVRLEEEGKDIRAGLYAYLSYNPSIHNSEWSYDYFEKHHMNEFIASFKGFDES
jgi:gamma-glutamylcyclotransferase (GGCT)/AIG2-like uncharacterized protein YtfP